MPGIFAGRRSNTALMTLFVYSQKFIKLKGSFLIRLNSYAFESAASCCFAGFALAGNDLVFQKPASWFVFVCTM